MGGGVQCTAVINGNHDGFALAAEPAAEGVVAEGISGEHTEATAMDVEDDRPLPHERDVSAWMGWWLGEEETSPHLWLYVAIDRYVLAVNAMPGFLALPHLHLHELQCGVSEQWPDSGA